MHINDLVPEEERRQVVKMWRSLGLIVLQVDEGNF